DTVDPAIPGATAEIMVQPFDERPRQRFVPSADQPIELGFELPEIFFLVESRGAGVRVELAVERPEDLARAVAAIGQIEEVAQDFAAAAVQRDRVAPHPARGLL